MKKYLIICTLAAFLIAAGIFTVSAYTNDGTFTLYYSQNTESSPKYLSDRYPIVTVENYNKSTDGELAVSIMKKGLLGYSLKERIQVWMKNKPAASFYFGNYGSGTFKTVYVANKINGSGNLAGGYYMYSSYMPIN